MQWGFLNIGVIVRLGLLLPEKVEGGGDFYLTAVVEHVQREEEEVENTEKQRDRKLLKWRSNTENQGGRKYWKGWKTVHQTLCTVVFVTFCPFSYKCCYQPLFSDGIIEPVDIVDIVIVADGDVDDDYDGEGGEHEEQQDGLVQVVELDKGGEGENTENNMQAYSNFG